MLQTSSTKQLWAMAFAAFAAFSLTFTAADRSVPSAFWTCMTASAVGLTAAALRFESSLAERLRKEFRTTILPDVVLGLLSAFLLYGVFWAGNAIVAIVIPAGAGQIQNVYALRSGVPLVPIILAIALAIGPGEEIFWRGFMQNRLEAQLGARGAVLPASFLYSAVHVASFNPMLLLAAFICGLFWGTLYCWKKSLRLNIVSHVVWDLLVFVVAPFST